MSGRSFGVDRRRRWQNGSARTGGHSKETGHRRRTETVSAVPGCCSTNCWTWRGLSARRSCQKSGSAIPALAGQRRGAARPASCHGRRRLPGKLSSPVTAGLAGRTVGPSTRSSIPHGPGRHRAVWLPRRSDGRFDSTVAEKFLNPLTAQAGRRRALRARRPAAGATGASEHRATPRRQVSTPNSRSP